MADEVKRIVHRVGVAGPESATKGADDPPKKMVAPAAPAAKPADVKKP